MSDLAEWLLEQIALQEARAQGDIEHFGESSEPRDQWIEKMARQFLAECDAKRRIIELYQHAQKRYDQERDSGCGDGSDMEWLTKLEALEPVARHLALPYADRPGYREEW